MDDQIGEQQVSAAVILSFIYSTRDAAAQNA